MEVPITEQPPPPPPSKQMIANIVEVQDDEVIQQELDITFDVEVNEETVIEEVVYEAVDEPIEEEVAEEIFTIVEDAPQPKGGIQAFYQYVAEELKYPLTARRIGVQGRVFVQFVVNKDGSISDAVAIRGIGGGCDEEAVRVINKSPKWTPGKQRGVPVKVRMVMPIRFQMADL